MWKSRKSDKRWKKALTEPLGNLVFWHELWLTLHKGIHEAFVDEVIDGVRPPSRTEAQTCGLYLLSVVTVFRRFTKKCWLSISYGEFSWISRRSSSLRLWITIRDIRVNGLAPRIVISHVLFGESHLCRILITTVNQEIRFLQPLEKAHDKIQLKRMNQPS